MACDRSRLQILAFCCSPFLHRMSKLCISKYFLPRIPTRYDLTVSYSVSSQQLGSINMLSSCVSGVFLNTTISCQKLGTDILTITWAYSTQPGLSALSRSEFKTVLSWLLSHHLILQRSLPQSTGDRSSFLLCCLYVAQLGICKAATQDLALTLSELSWRSSLVKHLSPPSPRLSQDSFIDTGWGNRTFQFHFYSNEMSKGIWQNQWCTLSMKGFKEDL